jgi:hypothetical protein
MNAIHEIGIDLNMPRAVGPKHWVTLGIDPADVSTPAEARHFLADEVRKFIEQAKLRPRFFWNFATDRWQIDLDSTGPSNVLALLVIHLMLRVADKGGFAVCSVCGRSYVPTRTPSAKRFNYCPDPDCRRKVWARRKREQRLRKGKV